MIHKHILNNLFVLQLESSYFICIKCDCFDNDFPTDKYNLYTSRKAGYVYVHSM